MAQYVFGTGLLAFTPAGANPTPVQCGVLQDVSINFDSTQKELRGQYRSPVDVALADLKISGKAKMGQFYGALLNQLFLGSTLALASNTIGAQNEVAAIAATVTVTHSATYVDDLGVVNASTGTRMIRVASAPAVGQYSVGGGTYTFNATDVAAAYTLWFSYSYTSTSGVTVSYFNQLMGQATTFTCTFFNSYGGKFSGFKFFSVLLPKLGVTYKNDDFAMEDLDFTCFAATNGKVFEAYSSE